MNYEQIVFNEVTGRFLGVLDSLKIRLQYYARNLNDPTKANAQYKASCAIQKDQIVFLENFLNFVETLLHRKDSHYSELARFKTELKELEQQNENLRLYSAYLSEVGEFHFVRQAQQFCLSKEKKRKATIALTKQKWSELY